MGSDEYVLGWCELEEGMYEQGVRVQHSYTLQLRVLYPEGGFVKFDKTSEYCCECIYYHFNVNRETDWINVYTRNV